jgi:3-deoxy-D-manno-octulosonate 8-phosphate phosphatase KdsC-like HAD superfamily phosphatase
MTKDQFFHLTGLRPMQAARHLGVSESTVSRWTDDVPGYAALYACARRVMTSSQRDALDEHLKYNGHRDPGQGAVDRQLIALMQQADEIDQLVQIAVKSP